MITTTDVCKQYGRKQVLHQVSFGCDSGRVIGLLGPNGAGKSTLMRIMVGLTPPTRGAVTYDGVPFAELPAPGHTVGVLLDASAHHTGRTGAEILRLVARSLGLPARRVREVLDLVALSNAEARGRVKGYSLGMRQRLGIARALLADPEVLILDEPANGLDPSGIRWIREVLANHAASGGTVVLSSHLIHEVELVADDLILIGHGQVLADGTKQDLLDQLQTAQTIVQSIDDARLAELLGAAGYSVSADAGRLIANADPAAVGRVATQHDIPLVELTSHRGSLEDQFFRLTDSTARESTQPGPGGVSNDLEGAAS